MDTMTGQVELRVTSPTLRTQAGLEDALERVATVIYGAFPQGGPVVAGDVKKGEASVLLSIDREGTGEWLPQLQALCAVIDGSIDSVSVARFVDDGAETTGIEPVQRSRASAV